MSNDNDYGYFGSGTEGYIHYMETVDYTMNSTSAENSSNRYTPENKSKDQELSTIEKVFYAIAYGMSFTGVLIWVYLFFSSKKL